MAVQWYYKMAGKEFGPFTSQELKQLAEEKRIAPTDPVRRDSDTEWSLAKNVKGLFPAAPAIPMGVAVPVTPVKQPPVVISAVKKPARPAKVEEPEEDSFDFGFDSSVSTSTKSHVSAKRSAKSAGKKAQKETTEGDEPEQEKKPLTKKEIQKRNFMYILIATGVVIVLAILILVIASCKGSSKPVDGDAEETVVAENAEETAEEKTRDAEEGAESKEAASDEEPPADENAEEASNKDPEGIIPEEYVEQGYKSPAKADGTRQSCTFGSAKVFVHEIKIAKLNEMNPKTRSKTNADREYCFIKIEIQNVSEDGMLLDVPGWGAKGASGVKLFGGEKNQYKTQRIQLPGQADNSMQVDSGEKFQDVLVFNAPNLASIEFLRLELPPIQKGDPVCKLYIPKSMFQPKADSASAKDKKAEGEEAEEGEAEGKEAEDAEAAPAKGEAVKKTEKAEGETSEKAEAPEKVVAEKADVPAEKPAAAPPEVPKAATNELDAAEESNDIFNDPSLAQ